MQAWARRLLLACVAVMMLVTARAEETVLPDGRRYAGEFNADGEPHGQGVMTWRGRNPIWGGEGRRYEGELRDGEPHGQGVMTWRGLDRQRYEGEFRDGRPHGKGVMTWQAMFRWELDESLGFGFPKQMLHPHEQRIEGDFRDGRPDGHVVMTWGDDWRYEGGINSWLQFHGHGVMSTHGWSYEGGYRAGQRHGQGVYTDMSGKRLDGNWDDGTFDGGIYTSPTGVRFQCFPREPCPKPEWILRGTSQKGDKT